MIELELATPEEGLTREEVRQRKSAGMVNHVVDGPSRTVSEIIRANVVTRFNILLGGLLLIVLFVLRQPRDALFGFVLLTNSAIGVIQELRAKRTLDRLELLAAPTVSIVREGRVADHPVSEIVLDDLIELRPGDQVVVDGTVVASNGLEIDESLLTGESDPVSKQVDDEVLSGSFVAAGSGRFRATRVGGDSYAARLAREGKRFTLVRSEMREGIDWILGAVSWVVIPMMILIIWSSIRGGGTFLEGLSGGAAAGVAMVPQGLVLLASIAFAVGVVRLGRRQVLVQEMPAIEGLARVDTICFDKTGTLTEGRVSVDYVVPISDDDYSAALAALVSVETHPNATLQAVAAAFPEPPGWDPLATARFSSARKWSGASFSGHGTWVIGAPEVVAPTDDEVIGLSEEASEAGRRVVLLARTEAHLSGDRLPDGLRPVCLLMLADQVRADAPDILRYFAEQGVDVKVISGDHPATVAAVAREAGMVVDGVVDARRLPESGPELEALLEEASVFGRVSPHQKREMVRALQARGHVVAMTGDGVNDVLALKDADIGIAVGGGAPASRAVAQLVLIDGQFASVPHIVLEGRRVTANVERVANLFITSTFYAFGLSLAVIISALPFPFLPRHLTLVGSLTIGIPAFFLALAPSRRRARAGFVSRVLRFAIPTGLIATAATFTGYWLSDYEASTIAQSRTTATIILGAIGMIALAIVARPLVPWKKLLLGSMIFVFLYVLLNSSAREFFALEMPRPVVLLAAVGIIGVTGTVMVIALRALGWVKAFPDLLKDIPPPLEQGGLSRLKQGIIDRSGWNRSFPTTTEISVITDEDEPSDKGRR
jgi:cation-transporting P-type ATPase E